MTIKQIRAGIYGITTPFDKTGRCFCIYSKAIVWRSSTPGPRIRPPLSCSRLLPRLASRWQRGT